MIVWWEALVLFLMYFGYVVLMKYNQALYKLLGGKEEEDPKANSENHDHSPYAWGGTFRAGIIGLIRSPEQWLESAGMGMVAKMVGDVDDAFREVDKNGDGY